MSEINWKLVYTTSTDLEAHHIRANLQGAEIPCEILSQVDTTRMFTIGELAVVKLFVPEEHFEFALEIINDIMKNDVNQLNE
jgi:hypothetical protein